MAARVRHESKREIQRRMAVASFRAHHRRLEEKNKEYREGAECNTRKQPIRMRSLEKVVDYIRKRTDIP